MFRVEVFIGKRFGAVDGDTACTIAVEEVSTLYHKV